MSQVGVLGGGIAGLTAAYHLLQRDVSVHLFEATDRVGGVIRSERIDDFLIEHGPNTLRSSPILEEVIQAVDLEEERVWADDVASHRYVVRDGKLVPVPTSMGSFFASGLLSPWGKLRLLGEPFIPRRSDPSSAESLADFARRRLGSEVLEYAVAPFVGGIYAGNPEQLSVRHVFEDLVQMEQDHGSLLWGALRSALGRNAETDVRTGLFSFRNGIETLPRALTRALEDHITRKAPVSALQQSDLGWTVKLDSASGPPRLDNFDAVICTVPLHALRRIDVDTSVDLSSLDTVPYPPLSVVALGYDRSAVHHSLDGFGFLVPPVETFDILGTLFSSTLFPNRVPANTVLLTNFVGGARAPHLADESPSSRKARVVRDLDRLLGLDDDPVFIRHVYWPRAIPQYVLGYEDVHNTLDILEDQHPRLFFAGNYRQGVAVGDAMASGVSAAEQAFETLTSPGS